MPPLLKKGDKVALVAPSRVIDQKQMKAAYRVLERWGLQVVEGTALYHRDGYFAGTDEERLADLQQFLDADVKAIFCARGGYGMTRIVDRLSFKKFIKNPKWVIGFSDITALHLATSRLKIESIHGLMPVQYGKLHVEHSLNSLYQLLFTGHGSIKSTVNEYNKLGKAEGKIIGGNLSLVAESLGTSTELQTEGAILVLEEIDEYLYKIDRMLNQLARAGKFKNLKGLVIGDFSDMKDTQIKFGKNVYELILGHISPYDFPVAFNVPIGHEALNLAFPVSRKVSLIVGDSGTHLSF